MRVLAIRIKNLASLDDAIIDFTTEPLNNAGIFAITGPTGAGKSTILDALCLALYAKTPRYRSAETGIDVPDVKGSTINQGDVRGILRDGTAEGFAEVDFAGVDGHHYRANWNVRRARGKADGNLQNYEITLRNINSNEDIPGKKSDLLTAIERLVGLNFEQFTRSVLLAQGDFTAFLKANKDEKSSLLEKLTGTHIYSEISIRIFEHHREEQQILRDLNTQRDGIQTLTAEEIDSLNEQKTVLTTSIKELDQELAVLNRETSWHEQQLKMQDNVASAQTEYDQANNAKIESLPREKHFQLVDRVQPARSIVHKLDDVTEQLSVKSRQSQELAENLSALQQQKDQLDLAVNAARKSLEDKVQEEENARPQLEAAKKLDIQLSEKATQVEQASKEAKAAQAKQTQHNALLHQTETQLTGLTNEITTLNQWKAENESRRPIAEQERIIRTRLTDASKILANLDTHTERLQKGRTEIVTHRDTKQQLAEQLNAVQQSAQLSQENSDKVEALLAGIDIKKLEDEKQIADAAVTDLISAEAHWRVLYIAITESQTLQQSLEQNRKDLTEQTEKLTITGKALESKKTEREASLKMLERARLAAADSIEKLREGLIAHEPCPVCGSVEHPYAMDNPALDKVLEGLEAQYKEIDSAYAELLATQSSLNQLCQGIKKNISKQETDLPLKTKAVQDQEAKWIKFTIYDQSKEIPAVERSAWLTQRLTEQKTNQDNLHKQLTNYRSKKQEQEQLKTASMAHAAKANELQNLIKDIDRKIESIDEQNTNITTEQQVATGNLENVKQDLSTYFPTPGWFENWQTDPQAFVSRIEKFATDWKGNLSKLEGNNTSHKVIEEKLKGLKEQSGNLADEIRVKDGQLSQLQSQQTQLSTERRSIFNGEPVSQIESNLKASVTASQQALTEKSKEAEKLQQEITGNVAQTGQLEKDKTNLSEQQQKHKKELIDWLQKYNQQQDTVITDVELLPLLNFTAEWIDSERKNLRAIDDTLTKTKSVLDERSKSLQIHIQQRLSERSLEELTARHVEVQNALRQNNQTVNEISYRITSDENHRKSHKTVLQQIEKQLAVVDNWGKLNEVIGSADGKKFRQIAQEYTLDVLLTYANVQLEVLSKRYVLQRVPNSLGLQVIDQDMGDEVRTVYSLSGGESFLVSLALALGLASLSSSKMKVESLFIDEGFGSLDPATLNVAMDALERLQNQGRKVGVISHVQDMTDRIATRIQVTKSQIGKSIVTTVGI